jgi:His-Xaa-Ser system protein HxsD
VNVAEGVLLTSTPWQPAVRLANGVLAFSVDLRLFTSEAVLRAAYKFTDRCHIFLQSGASDHILMAMMRPKQGVATDPLVGEFANELLDQRLRERLEQQFGNLRTLIVAQAFSEGNLLNDEREGDVDVDPRQIATVR